LESVPNDPEALFHLGNSSKTRGEFEKAVDYFELALKQQAEHIGLLNNLGLTFESIDRLSDAEQLFRKALKIEANSLESNANLAQNLFQQKRYKDALPWFDHLESRFSIADAAIWANHAVCLSKTDNLEGAHYHIQQALKIEQKSAQLYLDCARICSEMKRLDTAREALEQCISLEPGNAEALSGLIICNQKMGVWENLDEHVKALINILKSTDAESELSIPPFEFLAICDDPALQKLVACCYVYNKIPGLIDQKPGK
jgi:tetratricopeptide (TPR) repeat protein